MDLQKYTQVAQPLQPVILPFLGHKVPYLKDLFRKKIESVMTLPSKYIHDVNLDGKEYIAFQFYVGLAEQVVVACCIEDVQGNLCIHTRRFEKANVAGKALWGVVTNVFSGNRTMKKEFDLLKKSAQLVQGIATTSPLSGDARQEAEIRVEVLTHALEQVVNQLLNEESLL